MNHLEITGARVHNLKNIDISIPKNQITAITGVSGSGKSSLAFDIIFEEGRKKYLQSLGVFTLMDDEKKFTDIKGIAPTIAVQQNTIRQHNPRSTVGSRSRVLNMLALLYSLEGKSHRSQHGNAEGPLPPSYFSYNNPNGMCMECSGKGAYYELDLGKLVPEKETTLGRVFEKVNITPGLKRVLHRRFKDYLSVPFFQIPDEIKEEVIYGQYVSNNSANRTLCLTRIYENVIRKYGRDPQGVYQFTPCPSCGGCRVGEEARSVKINGAHIGELASMTLSDAHAFLSQLENHYSFSPAGVNLLEEIRLKIERLNESRLGHLSLYREITSLSGGELQRLFLNSHLESKMDSLIYILDEPTAGLHESEKKALLESIAQLKDSGNTVIVVEHDPAIIKTADHVIDIGPKAGKEGGEVVYQGNIEGLLKSETSITGRFLSGKTPMPRRKSTPPMKPGQNAPSITIRNARTNNLKSVSVSIPLGSLVGIAGVSGSGKSSLISKTLAPLLKNKRNAAFLQDDDNGELLQLEPNVESIEGFDPISGFVEVSQAPIGRNMNSTPVSYLGIWAKIRELFANKPKALENGFTAGHFSFNSKGACEACGGAGREKTWLGGNSFIYHTCKECHGKRYHKDVLSIVYKEKNIYDILETPVSEASVFFQDKPGIASTLNVLNRIGMGYIQLGQPTPTLSGGEAQRIKLAKAIGKQRRGKFLYILDEPTTGLCLYDTSKLIYLLDELVKKGNSVIVIEHDPAVLSACDWIIELGPEGGTAGGEIIAEGTPEDLMNNSHSKTGRVLKK